VPQFAAEMDGLVKLENVVVILTFKPSRLHRPGDSASGAHRPQSEDSPPGSSQRAQIFEIYLHEDLPLSPDLLKEHGDDNEKARQALVDHAMTQVFRKAPETEFIEVYTRSGGVETLYFKDLLSGALIMSIVERSKDYAIKRSIDVKSSNEGVSRDDITRAVAPSSRKTRFSPRPIPSKTG
jgi:proteasome-associated ATPase